MDIRFTCRAVYDLSVHDPERGSHLGLYFNGKLCKKVRSPEQAADLVCYFATDIYEWDCLDGQISPPTDLSAWILEGDDLSYPHPFR